MRQWQNYDRSSADKVLPLDKGAAWTQCGARMPNEARGRLNVKSEPTMRDILMSRADEFAAMEPSFARFLTAVVEASDEEDIDRVSSTLFESMFRTAFGRLGKRELASRSIHIVPPAAPGLPEVIEVFSADMPFIVDSVLAAIRAQGAVVRALVHPVLHFDPATYQVLDAERPGSRLESFLHVEVDPLSSVTAREAMRAEIDRTLTDVGRAVAGWRPMLQRLQRLVEEWHTGAPEAAAADVAEAKQFLVWLAEHNFTFLGMREYRLEGSGQTAHLVPVPDSELGILEDPALLLLKTDDTLVEMSVEHATFLEEPTPLLVTKANIRSRVHRRSFLDYVGAKLYDELGQVSGELRILGLFTSKSLHMPNGDVPLVRRKVAAVLDHAGLDPEGHDGKALLNVLETYPREELFQIETAQLAEFGTLIAGLADRPRVRVLARTDRFDTFVSVLVFVPRDRYDSTVRARIGTYLAQVFDAEVAAFYPSFPEGELVRVYFVLSRRAGPTPLPMRDDLEAGVAELIRTFADRLLLAARDPGSVEDFLEAFPPAYVERNSAEQALEDIETIKLLPDEGAVALRLYGRPDGAGLKLYHRRQPLPLSDRVPLLEHFGFRVIDEITHMVAPRGTSQTYLHDMLLEAPEGAALSDRRLVDRVETALLAVWRGEAESDELNQLVTGIGLGWEEVEILRALVRYLRQLDVPYSRTYLSGVLVRQAEFASALVKLFQALNDPHFVGYRDRTAAQAREALTAAIAATTSLDEDRILRHLAGLAEAVMRTNAYQRDETGARRPALALKFDGSKLDAAPEPRPFREIFVYSPRVEGLHLRFGPIARGGLRWSDRPEDFRTEVLGLVKAQQVKNAIIVPVGAKGAFVPRGLPAGASRDEVLREGVAAYKIFVSSLLDVTDSIEGDVVVPPPDVVRRDADDPYLVVAADKGTANFSDTANALALQRDFWLGDAFASGGSAGFDHKEMGITARGAWEAVKRHFRELGRDAEAERISVVGVGDMSGDVFGNGVLLSPNLRLLAAFDHRDIFIDPDPDVAAAHHERRRLFELERSSWQDYDPDLISQGGGVYSRSLKDVPLSTPARALLGLSDQPVTPADVIRAILRAEVDLIWFGGIGTYVRATTERDAEVGDRANDAVRVTGNELRALVVGEGANLAMTQRGRIEYALAGGRLDTDAIDNSAGVNSSDLEVNIKIALGGLVRAGQLDPEERDAALVEMTDAVAALCLRNNYLQTLAISLEERRGAAATEEHIALIAALEARGELHRAIEFLPDDATLRARAEAGRGLTRPELATLLAYSKISLSAALIRSNAPDDTFLARDLYRYFPEVMTERFRIAIAQHRLRREIIATVLSNAMINRGGTAFVHLLGTRTGADAGAVAAAYAVARDVFGTTDLNAAIDATDGRLDGNVQLALYAAVQALLRQATQWFLTHGQFGDGLQPVVVRFGAGLAEIGRRLDGPLAATLPPAMADEIAVLEARGVETTLARRIVGVSDLAHGLDVILLAQRLGTDVGETAMAWYGLMRRFRIDRLLALAGTLQPADRFEQQVLDRAVATLDTGREALVVSVLRKGEGRSGNGLAAWEAAHGEALARIADAIDGLDAAPMTLPRLSLVAGLVGDLLASP